MTSMVQHSSHPATALDTSADRAVRRQRAHELALTGMTTRQIGAELGVSHNTVAKDLKAHHVEMIAPLAEELRQRQSDRLELLWEKNMAVLEREHLVVSEGRIVYDSRSCRADVHKWSVHKGDANPFDASCTCAPLQDSAPVLKAIEQARKLNESIRKLWGLDLPVKEQTADDEPIDDIDAALNNLAAALIGQRPANTTHEEQQ